MFWIRCQQRLRKKKIPVIMVPIVFAGLAEQRKWVKGGAFSPIFK
jgi:hypothetical protein